MADVTIYEEPHLIDTGRGFSVFYKGIYLYSKYNPKKNIITQIDSLMVPESTIVLCFSPVLDYGLQNLIKKTPKNSFILGIEYDELLMGISMPLYDSALFKSNQFAYIRTSSIAELIQKIERLPCYPFKYCITLNCSAAVQLYPDFYTRTKHYVDEALARFWINRVTLIQLGRNYQHNIFHNLSTFLETKKCCFLSGNERIKKPILVVGAGPSLDSTRRFIIENRQYFFLLAVDAAVPALVPEIQPDAVVLVESQYWIDSAFIGLMTSGIPLFADLTASMRVIRSISAPVYFFCTEYTKSFFLQLICERLNVLRLDPMGSVGLTALQLALRLTETPLPVFHTGLDFSWGKGLTHARSSSPIKKLYTIVQRTYSCYALNFPSHIQSCRGKNNTIVWSTANLINYAQMYRHSFAYNNRVIDIGLEGVYLTEHISSYDAAAGKLANVAPLIMQENFPSSQEKEKQNMLVFSYLETEVKILTAILEHFQGEKTMSEQKFTQVLTEREYLYHHFPDAERGYSTELHFLKRIRVEIIAVLKIISRLFVQESTLS